MRKITQQAVNAFLENKDFALSNTKVMGNKLYLFENCIARRAGYGKIEICFCGWVTPTTRERLNGLVSAFTHNAMGISTKQGKPLLVCRDSGKKTPFDGSQWLLIDVNYLYS